MKWLLGALMLVGCVFLVVSGREEVPVSEASAILPAASPDKRRKEETHSSVSADEQSGLNEPEVAIEVVVEDDMISIGEPMDPDVPAAGPAGERTEFISIGEPMDPDNPATGSANERTEAISIGEPMNPDDPATDSAKERAEDINIGEPMDPDDPSTWSVDARTEAINIGDPMDPDNPSTRPRDGR